jgi:hypothetical protein
MNQGNPFPDPAFVQRTLSGYAREYAGLFALFGSQPPARQPDLASLRGPMLEHYRYLLAPPVLPLAGAQALQGAAVLARWQQAADRFARLAGAIARDASERLMAALAENGPGAPPITTLRELHELWIECGEAAYAAAAHGEEFSAAQAELLAAMIEMHAAASPP